MPLPPSAEIYTMRQSPTNHNRNSCPRVTRARTREATAFRWISLGMDRILRIAWSCRLIRIMPIHRTEPLGPRAWLLLVDCQSPVAGIAMFCDLGYDSALLLLGGLHQVGYQHALKLERDVGQRAVDGLLEFGGWARAKFMDDILDAFDGESSAAPALGDIDIDEIRNELLDDYPNGYDWTGISDASLIHSPNQVIYVSIDNPNHTLLARDVLPADAWPSSGYRTYRPSGGSFQIPMDLGSLDAPIPALSVLWWRDITWPPFVGVDAMSALFQIMDRHGALKVWASIAEAEHRARKTFERQQSNKATLQDRPLCPA